MTELEKLFQLQQRVPFKSLNLGELQTLANVARVRFYEPEEQILNEGTPVSLIIVPVVGNYEVNGESSSQVLGMREMFSEKPFSFSAFASKDGMTALCFNKGHLFTALFECPDLIIDYLEGGK